MNIKAKFPIFKNNPELVYLDNAATSQKPQQVIDSIVKFYTKNNANVHRGLYPLSEKSTEMYEAARKTIADFINAEPDEIIFTSGTTDGINAIAESLKNSGLISDNPRIVLTELEHHSNILPWQRLTSEMVEYISLNRKTEELVVKSNEFDDTDVLAITLASNVTGTIIPFGEIKSKYQAKFTIVDAAQAVAHFKIDVKKLDADFIVFSGHKMFGPTGIGIIWAKKELLQKMEPFRVGGGMITEVKRNSADWSELPEKFEAGTPPISEAIALAEAVRFIEEIGFDEIHKREQILRKYLVESLQKIPGVKLFHPKLSVDALAVISFTVEGIHPHDLAQFLGERNICVRAGHHCTQILHREIFEIPASVRASLSIYNSKEDIDKLAQGILEAIKTYKK